MSDKFVVWGKSKLLELYIENKGKEDIKFIIDGNWSGIDSLCGIEVIPPYTLQKGDNVVVFAISNHSLQSILKQLDGMGYHLGKNVELYSDILLMDFFDKVNDKLKMSFLIGSDYNFIRLLHLTSFLSIHTTIFGNLLFTLLMNNMPSSNIAEIGCFCGGNLLVNILCNKPSNFFKDFRNKFYLIDSFEGFSTITDQDKNIKQEDYKVECSKDYIKGLFSKHIEVKVIKGFVPKAFEQLDDKEYGLVFYDCDLYQPALDTFEYFWPRIVRGGFMMVHDYSTLPGVRKATDEFFEDKGVEIIEFWEATSCVIHKK